MKTYVGIVEGGTREVFRAATTPTQETHGQKYLAVIGPFRTRRAAEFMRDYGRGNPHCLCVQDAEYLTRAATKRATQRAADRVDGYDRDDLGESPDY